MSEYLQFAVLMVFFILILAGSYWFVLYSPGAPNSGQEDLQEAREREADD